MPTYQYACTACGEQHEAVQSFTDPALTDCPQCGGLLRKVYSAVGVVFKGSGFYKTDSRKAGTSDSGAKADGAATTSSAGDAATTPAAKPKESSTSSSSSTTSTPAAKTA